MSEHDREHDQILEDMQGVCSICGKNFGEIAIEDNFSDITTGSHSPWSYDENPSLHNMIKIMEG